MPKRFLVVAALAAMSTPHVLAQSSNAPMTAVKPSDGVFLQQDDRTQWRASKLIGVGVNGPDDKKIGNIDDILVDSTGNARAVVVRVSGDEEKSVAMPFTSLTISRSTSGNSVDRVSVAYRKEDLQKAPAFKWAHSNNGASSVSR
jgi:hypothetical protein